MRKAAIQIYNEKETNMKKYLKFFKKCGYPIDTTISVIQCIDEGGWKYLYTALAFVVERAEQFLNLYKKELLEKNIINLLKVDESPVHHINNPDETWKDFTGYYTQTGILDIALKSGCFKDVIGIDTFLDIWNQVKDSEYLIILRNVDYVPVPTITIKENFLLNLFHEMTHIYEAKTKKKFYHGEDTKHQVDDDQIIYDRLVKRYLKQERRRANKRKKMRIKRR